MAKIKEDFEKDKAKFIEAVKTYDIIKEMDTLPNRIRIDILRVIMETRTKLLQKHKSLKKYDKPVEPEPQRVDSSVEKREETPECGPTSIG